MIAEGHLRALRAVVKFANEMLEGRCFTGDEDIRQLTEDVRKAKQAVRSIRRSPDLAPLTDGERELMTWLWESTVHWRGGKMPEDWPEYDRELAKAKQLLGRLGVKVEMPE